MENKKECKTDNIDNNENENEKKQSFRTLTTENGKYRTLLTRKFIARKPYAKKDPKKITSFIPGTIKKMFVKEGDTIKKNSKLLILEAMKMENTIYAPFDGKIKKVHVKLGDVLPKGSLLIEYA